VQTGDVVIKHSAGGGGGGEPFTRDPDSVLDDVLDEFVTIEAAERTYGVAIDLSSMQIDLERTRALRSRAGTSTKAEG